MRTKTVQAKHLSDEAVLAALGALERDRSWGTGRRWVNLWEVCDAFPDYPAKVVLAKMRALLRRNVIGGCGCGCRGDFYTRDGETLTRWG